MACKRMKRREIKRVSLSEKYKEKREQLREIIGNRKGEYTLEEIENAFIQLGKLPRDISPIRQRNRCYCCGRPRGYIREFGLCRICFRQRAGNAEITGTQRSSW